MADLARAVLRAGREVRAGPSHTDTVQIESKWPAQELGTLRSGRLVISKYSHPLAQA